MRKAELRDMSARVDALTAEVRRHIEKLQAEEYKTEIILDNMKEGFILLDGRQNILLINRSACVFMGCEKNVIGQTILHCTRNFEFLQAVEAAISGNRVMPIDMMSSGAVIEADFAIVAQPDNKSALMVTMSDVTARRNAVKIRRDFFTNASHELKTPITSIKGCAELLCADIPLEDSQRQELLTRIGIETQRMDSLINDIIMINRIESGETTGDREDVDLAGIVRECSDEAAPFAEQNGLTVNVDAEPAVLCANRRNLYAMVSNLVINAVKYNIAGGAVDISLKNDGHEIVLAIRNDGDPIPLEHQQRVFERFYRVDKGRSKAVGGTGLGLSIVKHVVDSLGGTIRLESNYAKGTTVTVRLYQ